MFYHIVFLNKFQKHFDAIKYNAIPGLYQTIYSCDSRYNPLHQYLVQSFFDVILRFITSKRRMCLKKKWEKEKNDDNFFYPFKQCWFLVPLYSLSVLHKLSLFVVS